MRKLILSMHMAIGDTVVFTGLIRDIKRIHGDAIQVDTRTNFADLWQFNPYVTFLDPQREDVEQYDLRDYCPGITAAGRGDPLHFMSWYHRDFVDQTGLDAWPTESKPDLHISPAMRDTPPITGRYWVVFGGGKTDMTTKHWEYVRYQELINRLRPYGLQFVQTGAVHNSNRTQHIHPPLEGVLNLVGWGGIPELLWQIYHAEGVICPITSGMHIAAAFDKPCVVIAGGREEATWESYTNLHGSFGDKAVPVKVPHRYLHTIGLLPCCPTKGCWKKRVVKLEPHDESLCWRPVTKPNRQTVPECMDMITVEAVMGAVLSYYEDGTLPPLR